MDRFVIREPRANADYPQGNQMIAFPSDAGNNMVPPENTYYHGNYGNSFPNMQPIVSSPSPYIPQMNTSMIFAQNILGTSVFYPHPSFLKGKKIKTSSEFQPVTNQKQVQIMSGIDPKYLAGYTDNSAQYIITGQQAPNISAHIQTPSNFGDYENRNFIGVERNKAKTFTPQIVNYDTRKQEASSKDGPMYQIKDRTDKGSPWINDNTMRQRATTPKSKDTIPEIQNRSERQECQWTNNGSMKSTRSEDNVSKNDAQNQIMGRSDKLKALYKTGPRVFSGPIEKVLKWHKSLQDIGILILYEVVAKCVSIRNGEPCAKNLVVRDDNGPAMQVVYYEHEFLLPTLKLPCTVRVIGRMMPRTSRLQAFSVRTATGDDVATLPRRAAIASHHVTKLFKEFGN